MRQRFNEVALFGEATAELLTVLLFLCQVYS